MSAELAEPLPQPPRLALRREQARREEAARAAAIVAGQLPTRVDLILYQGDDIYLNVNVSGSPPVNLTGYTPKAEIRSAPGSATLIASFVATIANSTTIALHLPATESAKLTADAAWDVQVTDLSGAVTTLAYGTVTLTKQVTL